MIWKWCNNKYLSEMIGDAFPSFMLCQHISEHCKSKKGVFIFTQTASAFQLAFLKVAQRKFSNS